MTNVILEMPEKLVPYTVVKSEEGMRLRNAMLIYPYIWKEDISYGKAASILGMNKLDLVALYGEVGLPYFDETAKELDCDVFAMERVLQGT